MHISKVPLTQLLPTDIGAAAAYEMYRTWKHNSYLYEPLSADRTQQREGLIGMAIAEGMFHSSTGGSPLLTSKPYSHATMAVYRTSDRHVRPEGRVRGSCRNGFYARR